MKNYVFIGRGGQGAKSAASILAKSAANQGLFIQAFPEYGPERMGAPVKAYAKISSRRIRSFSAVRKPDFILLIDKTLIHIALDLMKKNAVLIVNDACSPEKYNKKYGFRNKVVTIDASRISLKNVGMDKPNVPILGALADYDNFIMIDSMIKTVKDYFIEKGKEISGNNVKALQEAFKEASK